MRIYDENLVIVRGAGDIATGAIQKLLHAGFHVMALETKKPSAIRRHVALCEAVYEGVQTVEDITARRVESFESAKEIMARGEVAILIDPACKVLEEIEPLALVDAILAKKNLGTNRQMASITIALGPGFVAGKDVDIVVETMRGHHLGRLILEGSALPNTGVPGLIAGYGKERVIHAPCGGVIQNEKQITDFVSKGEVIARIDGKPVFSTMDGILRGLIRNGYEVYEHMKIADIDPRESERENCFTISDKARTIGGAVLEAVLMLQQRSKYQG